MLAPTLETPRLLLRHPSADDFEAFARFAGDEELSRFLGGAVGREQAFRSLCTIAGAWQVRGFSMFSVIEKATGAWVGRVGPWRPESWPGDEVGWGITREAQRKGYAKEAAIASMRWAFDTLGWERVIHCIEPENAPSIALAHSLGSTLVARGVAAPKPFQMTWDLYGQSRATFYARHGSS
jgi:RimJ/RimL family protein N-acetyltransferase